MYFVFFYPKHQVATIPKHQLSKLVANSLSKALTYYYPWAGSLKDNSTIECDDHGADFLEVDVNSPMDEVICQPHLALPHSLSYSSSTTSGALTVAQLSYFECGGIALSLCLSHKVGDGCSAYYFLRDWATLNRDPKLALSPPYFAEDSLFPSPFDGPLFSPVIKSEKRAGRIQKSFIFSESKINALKDLVVAESPIQNPTRNEVVNALLYKCVPSSTTNSGRSQLIQLSDLRHRTSSQLSLPPTTIGNIFTIFSTPIYKNYEQDLKLPKLVTDIRKSKHDLLTRNNLQENELIKEMLDAYRHGELPYHKRNCDIYRSTSMIAFEFEKIDFGFGKPARVSHGSSPAKNFFILMNTPDDHDRGVEAGVNLNEQDMSVFQNDKDLLQFATPI